MHFAYFVALDKVGRLPGRDPANRDVVICFPGSFVISLFFVIIKIDLTIYLSVPSRGATPKAFTATICFIPTPAATRKKDYLACSSPSAISFTSSGSDGSLAPITRTQSPEPAVS